MQPTTCSKVEEKQASLVGTQRANKEKSRVQDPIVSINLCVHELHMCSAYILCNPALRVRLR